MTKSAAMIGVPALAAAVARAAAVAAIAAATSG